MRDKTSHTIAKTLPPLNALRAFLAAARHLSFTRAAVELNVTHGAVSRQIRTLEEFLGIALFERQVRQVSLTGEGQQLFAEIEPAFAQIGSATRALMKRAPVRAVRINVRPTFAVRWLIPRLADFVARYPGIEPRVVTSTFAPDRVPETFDVAIRRGTGGWPPTVSTRPFLDDELVVVASPRLAKAHPIIGPESLASHVLLVCRTRKQDWDDWRKHIGLARLRAKQRLQFDHHHFVLQAAIDSLGVALVPASLLANDLRTKRLVMPMPELRAPLKPFYYGVAADAGQEANLFARWLGEQARHVALQK